MTGLTPIRVVGVVFAVALLVWAVRRQQRRQMSRLNLLIAAGIALGILTLAVFPTLFRPLFDALRFREGNQRQLIAAILFAVFVLFALLLRTDSNADANAAALRRLVEALAVDRFEGERPEIPEGAILVVVPAHNEAANVGPVLAAVPASVDGVPVVPLVVDDASDDATLAVARAAGAPVARVPIQRGQGAALRVGYALGRRLGARAVVSLDADGEHDPAELPLLVRPILAGEADLVIGSRRLGDGRARLRPLGTHAISWLLSLLHRDRITDASSGFRAASADLLRSLRLEQDQYSSEIVVEARRHGARIREVPISLRPRLSGASKKPRSLRYGWRFTKALFQTWLR